MEVITIETQTFQEIKEMFTSLVDMNERLVKENIGLKGKALLSSKEVAEITGYTDGSIRKKKNEIGYVSVDNMIRFEPKQVQLWIETHRIRPRK